ncbi:MAG: hypothetical protein L0H70_09640 [Xanthomonadales bacterium]|nr:hypothetical protein [Xanthomonadales bacterium]
MDIHQLAKQARTFTKTLEEQKQALGDEDFMWYPYGTLTNFSHLDRLLKGEHRELLALAGDLPIADIGAADGDAAFFLESLGYDVHAIDYPPTNNNGCRGIRALKQARESAVTLHDINLDAHFELPGEKYGLAFFLGILYHLKNPFGAMENLSRLTHHALLSTRITGHNVAKAGRGVNGLNHECVELDDIPAAYLVDAYETNNDPTNYWIFTNAGLKRLLDRCGWDVLDFMSVGATGKFDPATAEGDERAFCLIRSRHFQA